MDLISSTYDFLSPWLFPVRCALIDDKFIIQFRIVHLFCWVQHNNIRVIRALAWSWFLIKLLTIWNTRGCTICQRLFHLINSVQPLLSILFWIRVKCAFDHPGPLESSYHKCIRLGPVHNHNLAILHSKIIQGFRLKWIVWFCFESSKRSIS